MIVPSHFMLQQRLEWSPYGSRMMWKPESPFYVSPRLSLDPGEVTVNLATHVMLTMSLRSVGPLAFGYERCGELPRRRESRPAPRNLSGWRRVAGCRVEHANARGGTGRRRNKLGLKADALDQTECFRSSRRQDECIACPRLHRTVIWHRRSRGRGTDTGTPEAGGATPTKWETESARPARRQKIEMQDDSGETERAIKYSVLAGGSWS